jgi:hypothetical protein
MQALVDEAVLRLEQQLLHEHRLASTPSIGTSAMRTVSRPGRHHPLRMTTPPEACPTMAADLLLNEKGRPSW